MSESRPTPGQYVAAAVRARGADAVLHWVSGLLSGAVRYDSPDVPPLTDLVGGPAEWLLGLAPEERRRQDYWIRTWGARALLYVWDPTADTPGVPAVLSGLRDEHWRVREMAAKVVRAREIGEAADALVPLARDDVRRVRVAAVRALAVVGEAEHADALHDAEGDPEADVRRAAATALDALRRRLDRDL